jgi:hypothetical protein
MTKDTVAPTDSAQLRKYSRKPYIPDWITCAACGRRWTGLKACHCSACHVTFTSLTAFDIHRRNSICFDPNTINGLTRITKLYWSGWGIAGHDERWS